MKLTPAQKAAILRDVAAQPLTGVHPALEAERQRDGGARIAWMRQLADDLEHGVVRDHGVFGNIVARVIEADAAGSADDGLSDVERWARACVRGDCQYADAYAMKPDATRTCPGHRGEQRRDGTWVVTGHCARRTTWGEIHEQTGKHARLLGRDRDPGEEG